MSLLKRNLLFFLSLFGVFIFSSCSIPAPAYIINMPKSFQCSTDYDPNSPEKATWSATSCTGPSWIRFITYASGTDFSGWVIYRGSENENFTALIQSHMIDGVVYSVSSIVEGIQTYSASGKLEYGNCTQADDVGKLHPTISVNPIPQNTGNNLGNIKGTDTYNQQTTFVVIPPLECLSHGTFVVTGADYTNGIESLPSNPLTIN